MRKRYWLPLAALGVAAVGAAAFAAFAWRTLNTPLNVPPEGAWLEISSGTPLRRVGAQMNERGLLLHPFIFSTYARVTGDATRVRAGEYQILPGTTPLGLLEKLVVGQVYFHQLTVVEGWRFSDLLAAVRAHPAVESTSLDAPAIMAEIGAPGVHPEGQFFPDTYAFPRGTTDVELLRTAHRALLEKLELAWQRRSADIPLASAYEALILASIIEKETALPAERKLISGVFHQRLRRRMRLQTDPTVIYGLGETFDGDLRRRDLDSDTPYNTYTRSGLPPTPIALPGEASIEAAVAPDATDAVYFVATGRGDGSHYFSSTLEEHERAVSDYLRQLRERER
jgi:UPF0755 protein